MSHAKAIRDGVENDVKRLGTTIKSRQIEAVISTLGRVVDGLYDYIEELESRIEMLEGYDGEGH